MKIFWINCDLISHCFFRLSQADAQGECDFRMEEKKKLLDVFGLPKDEDIYGNWFVEEEDIPDNVFGKCKNDDGPRLPYQMDCSVGMVRKLRSGVPDDEDDGTCRTCPYFIEGFA